MVKSAVTKTRLLKSVNDTIKKLKLTDDVTTSQGVRFIYVDYKESVDDAVGKIITSLNRIYGVNKEFKEQTTKWHLTSPKFQKICSVIQIWMLRILVLIHLQEDI